MTALAVVLGLLAALAVAGCAVLWRRLEQLHADQLRHERAIGAEARVRVLSLETQLDQVRAQALGALPPSAAELAERAHASELEIGGERVPIPREVQRELDAIEDAEHRGELRELATYRLAQGESAEEVIAGVFGG